MFSKLSVVLGPRRLRSSLAMVAACVGCNSIFGIDDPVRRPACTLSTDCPPDTGQVCLFSRCSEPCAADVECTGPGERCLRTDQGSACVGVEATCDDTSSPCPSGTACDDGACYAVCSAAQPCLGGHVCEDGVCKGTPAATGGTGGGGGGNSAGAGADGTGGTGNTGGNPGASGEAGAPPVAEDACGDGAVTGEEECDDEDTEAADGCSSSCTVESGWECDQNQPSNCSAICGDGRVLGLEALAGGCDDDNERPDDGCSPSCTVEMSFACSGEPSTCNKTCGNGQVEQGETCDDENTAVGDGCVSCAVESGFECEPGTMPSDCSDVNECADNKHNCHAQATCTNTAGSFSCACKGGLTGNGVSCSFAQLVGKLDGRLITVPCSDTPPADDCTITGAVSEGVTKACSAGQLDAIYDHPIGGPPGVEYTATLHFYGVAEPRSYGPGVTREAGLVQPENLDTGASPAPYGLGAVGGAIRVSSYSTLEVRVFDQSSVEVGSYFLNSDTGEGHYTYVLNYERPIRIVGGGFVRVRRVDTNCRIIKNCNGGTDCGNNARSVDISAANPQPVGLVQPGLGQPAAHSGQWLLVDVTKVELL